MAGKKLRKSISIPAGNGFAAARFGGKGIAINMLAQQCSPFCCRPICGPFHIGGLQTEHAL
jgi:hypothetical protein